MKSNVQSLRDGTLILEIENNGIKYDLKVSDILNMEIDEKNEALLSRPRMLTAKEIINSIRSDREITRSDGRLRCSSPWVSWCKTENQITLDGEFSYKQLEAIAYWMKTNLEKDKG